MKIPVYLIDINLDDESTGMGAISFVEDPAIESNFICFDKDSKPMMFKVENEMEHKVMAVPSGATNRYTATAQR